MEIPTKIRDYYRGFKEVNINLLLSNEYYFSKVLLTLGNEPKSFKQVVKGPEKEE